MCSIWERERRKEGGPPSSSFYRDFIVAEEGEGRGEGKLLAVEGEEPSFNQVKERGGGWKSETCVALLNEKIWVGIRN